MPAPDPSRSLTFKVISREEVARSYGETSCHLGRIDPATGTWLPGAQVRVQTADPAMLGMLAVGNVVRIGMADGPGEPARPVAEG